MEQPNPHKIEPWPVTHGAVAEMAEAMNKVKYELGRMHFFKTMKALDKATQALGYEAAEHLK